MNTYVVHVEYMGVMRLLLQKKQETFTFSSQPSLETLINAIAGRYGAEIEKECRKQLFVLYQIGVEGARTASSKDLLADGSLIRIVSMVTGG